MTLPTFEECKPPAQWCHHSIQREVAPESMKHKDEPVENMDKTTQKPGKGIKKREKKKGGASILKEKGKA